MSVVSPMVAKRVGSDAPGTRQLLMLHGIYGRGRNWLAVARTLVERRPDWCCWLADMRHHGDAHPGPECGTLDALAGDITTWGTPLGVVPDAVLGHSFGGKVALAYAAREARRPLQTWVIDSTPEAKPPSGSAWDMLGIVRRLPQQFRSRQEAIAGIETGGFSTEVAQWMSTNLVHEADAFRWKLDFDVMEQLLHEFFRTSLWPVLDPGAPGHDIHVLKATQSSVISAEAVARMERLQGAAADGRARVHVHHREGGHWIHAESPGVVVDLLAEWLPR
ncbi:alpha/beta hydrolase [Luteitalea sp. TBR-22]|uniref:alpha/beta fold hydrolase n=1 Tax=Luteitalea sp. TBR-22 TaxID=2802971 RepID=UPI001AFC81FF|nr:alpha/beta hydrolase [Luteitalea sp. TBR-22]BCS33410.1 alpha/beta hydrolase [Luteitalea sp. TBR-22]